MKKWNTFALLFILTGCIATKRQPVIPYVLDLHTEQAMYQEILRWKGDLVFYVEHLPSGNMKFHLMAPSDKEQLRSARKLFINDKLYPIVFESDYWFYAQSENDRPMVTITTNGAESNIPMPTIRERIKDIAAYGYPRKSLIIDHGVYWIVDKKGKLVETNVSQ